MFREWPIDCGIGHGSLHIAIVWWCNAPVVCLSVCRPFAAADCVNAAAMQTPSPSLNRRQMILATGTQRAHLILQSGSIDQSMNETSSTTATALLCKN